MSKKSSPDRKLGVGARGDLAHPDEVPAEAAHPVETPEHDHTKKESHSG